MSSIHTPLLAFEDVVSWGLQAQILPEREAANLRALAQRRSDEAAAAHTRAVNLRETLHTIFAPTANGRPIKRDTLATLNAMLPELLVRSRLTTSTEGLVYHWIFDGGDAPSIASSGPSPSRRSICSPRGISPTCINARWKPAAGCSSMSARTRPAAGAR